MDVANDTHAFILKTIKLKFSVKNSLAFPMNYGKTRPYIPYPTLYNY